MEKIIITGAGGYLGSNLIAALEKKNFELHLFSRKKFPAKHALHQIDVSDFGAMEAKILEIKPDYIAHLAAIGFSPNEKPSFEKLAETNFYATRALAQACQKLPNFKKFIFPTTYMECAGTENAIKPDDAMLPQTEYALSKSFSTSYLSFLWRTKKLDACSFRLFSVYGLNDRDFRFIPSIFGAMLEGKSIQTTSLLQKRDFVFVQDVVDAMMLALVPKRFASPIYNVGSGKPVALADVANKIKMLFQNSKGEIKIGAKPERAGEAQIYLADISKTQSELGWAPKYSLDEGLGLTYAFYKGRKNSQS